MKYKSILINGWPYLLIITIIGLILRLKHLGQFDVVPDSYNYLLSLGKAIYSEKIVYILLLKFVDIFFNNPKESALFLSLISSTLNIILVYLILKRIFKVEVTLIATSIYAFSFSNVFWGGQVGPESISITFLLLAALYFKNIFVYSMMILLSSMIRPEFIIFLSLLFLNNVKFWIKIVITIVATSVWLYIISKYSNLLQVRFVSFKEMPLQFITDYFKINPISFFALLGVIPLFRNSKKIFYSLIILTVSLLLVYIYINPLNWRYNLIFLLPTIYLSAVALENYKSKFLIKPLFIILIIIQILISFRGLSTYHDHILSQSVALLDRNLKIF